MTAPQPASPVDVFKGLTHEQIQAIIGTHCYVPVHQGEHVFREGEPAFGLFVITRGGVEIYRDTPQGEIRLAELGPGESFGEMGLIIDTGKRTASARASEETLLLGIHGDPSEFFSQLPDPATAVVVLQNLICLLADRLHKADQWPADRDDSPVLISEIQGEAAETALDIIRRAMPRRGFLWRETDKLKLQPGQYLCRQGDDPEDFYFLESGEVDVIDETAGRDARVLTRMKAPNIVGEIGFFAGQKRMASVRAADQVTYTRFSGKDYKKLHKSNPPEALRLLFAAAQLIVRLIVERQQAVLNKEKGGS